MSLQLELQKIAHNKLNKNHLDKEISQLHKELVSTVLKDVNELTKEDKESINTLIKKCLESDGKLFLYNIDKSKDKSWYHGLSYETESIATAHHEKLAIKYIKEVIGDSFNCKLLIDNCDCEYLKITLKKQ